MGLTGWSTSNYLRRLSQVVNTYPFMISGWGTTSATTGAETACHIGLAADTNHRRVRSDPETVTALNGGWTNPAEYDAVTVSGSERTLLAFSMEADNNPVAGAPTGYGNELKDETTTGIDGSLLLYHLADQSSDGAVTASGPQNEGFASMHISVKPPVVSNPRYTLTVLGIG